MQSNTLIYRMVINLRSISMLMVIAVPLFMWGCTASPVHRPAAEKAAPLRSAARTIPAVPEKQPSMEQRLRAEIRTWRGTPHRMGGTDRNGVDCSGFVQRVYNDLFNIRLPRSTALQVRIGNAVDRNRLHPGDLVFFHPPQKIRHVGVYLGNGEFAHASTSKGVIISRLNTAYWYNSYWTARRPGAL